MTVLAPDDLTLEHAQQLAQKFANDELDYADETQWDIQIESESVRIPARDRISTDFPYSVLNDRFTEIVPASYADWWKASKEEVDSEVVEEPNPNQLPLF